MDVLVKFGKQAYGQIQGEVYEGRVQSREAAAMFINAIACCYLCEEIATKSEDSAVHELLESAAMVVPGALVKASCPKAQYQELLPLFIETTDGDDVVLSAAACVAMDLPVLSKTGKELAGAYLRSDPVHVMWGVRRRVVEPGLPAGRWRELAQTLSMESVCVNMSGQALTAVAMFLPTIPHDGVVWSDVITECVHVARANCEAKLSQQQRFSYYSFHGPLTLLARAARDTAHHPALMPAAKALLWAAGNGYTWVGQSTAELAAAACVSLLGRNEGGLTLDQATVCCVLNNTHRYFDASPTADWISKMKIRDTAKKATPKVQLVADMVIADASEL